MFECPLEADYYGFADADDVWIRQKLAYTIGLLEGAIQRGPGDEYPVAVCTRLQVVDRGLRPIGLSQAPRIGLRFENALVETVASGASVLMNPAAWRLLRTARPQHAVMHDAWVYLVITAFGIFEYGDQPTILYRQHGANIYGTSHSWRQRLRLRLRRFRASNPYWEQAKEFSVLFGSRIEPAKRAALQRYTDYRRSFLSRLAFALHPAVVAQSHKANLFYRLLFLLGRG